MYKLSKNLIDKLAKENIRYCHWKSNYLLDDALDGYDDLDLLVSRDDISKFEIILLKLNFKEAINTHISFNGVKHFYGYDRDSGEILHLHIYYVIKTGASWTKSIHFDFEEYILDNLTLHKSGMLIPKKYIELVIFIFRVMVKYSKINEFILAQKEHKRTLNEIIYLQNGTNKDELREFLDKFFPNIKEEEFYSYIEIIRVGSNIEKYFTGKRVVTRLKNYRYISSFKESYKNISQLLYRISNRLFFKRKKRLSTGVIIAITGLDATGKSTVTNDLKKWLGKNFTTHLTHFGKPTSSILTYPFNLLIKILRREASSSSSMKSSIQKNGAKSLPYIIRQLILAYDRYRVAKRYWDMASAGDIVIFDRYKSENCGVMDSHRLDTKYYSGLKLRLVELENNLYKKIPKPNIIFYLTVPLDIAVERNEKRIKEGKESREFIKIRHKLNQNLIYNADHIYTIDTNKPYQDEIKEIKSKIWRIL